ncbi:MULTISPECIES: PfkB family carbohydrate kinase [Petrotoga]|uniref:Sugar/nucleoside kinase (Ribokinase family) n=1 Tax=Petrotoga sibirica TaxID=156202 RepID=A0A4R8EUV3_9BACT|nr:MULTISPECIES: PfkB family carbohydrate kinase [Petrotoga]KUK82855.1 MAG: PfkB domain protein [Petrotoga mobilis]TDX16189.1 sugar/nucleoside kinase (ribokinase family) [Petrotoga sibirica]
MATIDVIGGIFLDIYILKNDGNHNSKILQLPGGSALNVAIGLARLGHNVRMFGNVGKDFVGEFLLEKLSFHSVNVEWIKKVDQHTATFITMNEKPIAVDRRINDLDLIIPKKKSEYLFITTETNERIINSNIFLNYKKTFFDIGPRPKLIDKKCENVFFIGNEKECKDFLFTCDVVKLGKKGAKWGEKIVALSGRKASYQIGMGDVFDTVFIDGILNNIEKEQILHNAVNATQKVSEYLGAYNKIINI